MLKLMYITNDIEVAKIAQDNGVDRIFVDLEYIGKEERQKDMDTVKSKHTVEDIKKIKEVLSKSELLVRVNPIHDNSENEINEVIKNGADIIMLPFFKTVEEVAKFLEYVNNNTKTCLLLETPEAVEVIDEILDLNGIDEIHIGLNDLHLGYKKKFMFELISDGTVEMLCNKFKKVGIKYGFGGIAALGNGAILAEMIIKEHYRIGSTRVILSRSFCNTEKVKDLNEIRNIFEVEVRKIRDFENDVKGYLNYFKDNKKVIDTIVESIVS